MEINNRKELWIARTTVIATLIGLAGFFRILFLHFHSAYVAHHTRAAVETAIFAVAMLFTAYGNLLYQICLAGYHKRVLKHRPPSRAELESFYDGSAPSLAVLVPSYKEEYTVIWQTLVSAALAEYPRKEIVLLIDDPCRPASASDIAALQHARDIPLMLQRLFEESCMRYRAELEAFEARVQSGRTHSGVECNRLSLLYDAAADWLDELAEDFIAGRPMNALSHIDRFFLERVIGASSDGHRERAMQLRAMINSDTLDIEAIRRQYRRLANLFAMRFSSFERKKYVNLSHEANKAMNLNSYIALLGKSWKEIHSSQGLVLMECMPEEADFSIPAADYINTVDADTQMLPDYTLQLVHRMQRPGSEKIAVVQSPCSAYPGAPASLERAAGAAIDMQFETHQGYAHWNAAFWVGANAMLRYCALEEVREVRYENNHPVSVYIKDRTVIEDTESSIDLVHKGWELCNHPARMTFSAMPSDFGSLLIQRRRWANGGLLILPNLIRYIVRAPKNPELLKECFMRLHYLVSSASGCLVALLLFLYSFCRPVETPWLALSMLPFFLLYIRDLRNVGYRLSDMPRIFALNLMLLPVIAGGVLKSLEQMMTGHKIPFSRTPKVPGRTAAPAFYSLIEMALPLLSFGCAWYDATHHHWLQAFVALTNGLLLTYAAIYFLGIKHAMQDIVVGGKAMWNALGRNNPMPSIVRRVRRLLAAEPAVA